MDYSRSEYKVGIVVLVAVVLTVGFIFSITNIGKMLQTSNRYTIRFEYLDGLKENAEVNYAGYKMGLVKEIRLDLSEKGGALVVVEVDESVRLRAKDRASIATEGLLGVKLIDIVPGPWGASLLDRNDILEGEQAPTLKNILASANKIAGKITEAVTVISSFFGGTKLEHSIQSTLEKISKTLDKVEVAVSNVVTINGGGKKGIKKLLEDEALIAGRLTKLVNVNSPKIDRSVADLEATMKILRPRLDAITKEIQVVSEKLANVSEKKHKALMSTIDNLKSTSANLKTFSAEIKRRPWRLLRK